jgi:KRAB domain-containing zinc finger protein
MHLYSLTNQAFDEETQEIEMKSDEVRTESLQYEEYVDEEELDSTEPKYSIEIIEEELESPENSPKKSSGKKDCVYCGISISNGSWMQHYYRVHSENSRFHCDLCGKGFRVKRDLGDHMKSHQNIEYRQKYPCFHCPSQFLSKSSLKTHNQTFHSDFIEEHPCECGKIFSSRLKLQQHILVVHKKGSYPCQQCGKDFRVKYNLTKHIRKDHGEKIPCRECGKLVAPGRYMRLHLESHNPPKFECNYKGCTKKFQSEKSLNYHVETQHVEQTKNFECPTCSSLFNSTKNLKRHISRQHNTVKIPCAVDGCDHMASRKDYLVTHYKTHKGIDEDTRTMLLEKVKTMKEIPW